MADITLAEFNDRVWLVGGENYIDDFLFNSLPPEITVEIVPCDSLQEVTRMWTQLCSDIDPTAMPWAINPAIVDRVRRKLSGHSVYFAEWSASIEKDGRAVIATVAEWWRDNKVALIDVVDFLAPNAPKSAANLSQLRGQLVEEALVEAGVAVAQITRVTREPGKGHRQDSQRIEIAGRIPEAN